MNDAAELERKRLERFLVGGAGAGKKAPTSFKTNAKAEEKPPTSTSGSRYTSFNSPRSDASSNSLGSSPSYKHEEKRKWELKQERDRAEFAAATGTKKHLEMEDSAAQQHLKAAATSAPPAGPSVESYEERERRRRAEWKKQQSPSLALLELLDEGDEQEQLSPTATKSSSTATSAGPNHRPKLATAPAASPAYTSSTATTKSNAPSQSRSTPDRAAGVRSESEEAALRELLGSPSTGSKTSPRLTGDNKQQTANTFAQIGDVLNSLNDLLGPEETPQPATSAGGYGASTATKAGAAVDGLYSEYLPTAAAASSSPSAGKSERANARPKTKEERRREKEARRPQWAQTLYDDFLEGDDQTSPRQDDDVDRQLWRVDLEQEERESKEFVKDAQDGLNKLEAVSSMIEPDMDVDDFDEERFSVGVKEFFYSGRKTVRYIKRKSRQGSVRMAGEAKKFMDDSVALMDTARDYKASRTEKAKAKFSRTVKKVKEGAQRLTKTVSSAVEEEVERMKELRDKVRAADRDRKEREACEAQEREARKASAEREASVTRLSFELDQFLYGIKKIEDDAFLFDYGGAVDMLKRVRDVKESVPRLLAYLSGGAVKQFAHLNDEITDISTAAARFVKDWQTGGKTKAESMRQTGEIVKLARQFQQNLMDLILFI